MRKDRLTNLPVVRVPDWPDAWHGWRFAADRLVAPDGSRITQERLRGLLWRQDSEARLAKLRATREAKQRVSRSVVTVLRVSNADWHRERFGTIAG